MNRNMIAGLVAGAVAVAAGGAFAGYAASRHTASPDLAAANAGSRENQAPRETCWNEQVTHQREPKDGHRIIGSVAGAVVGGIVGNQFGSGKGNGAATAVGVVGGGYAGNQIQESMQKGDTVTTTERRCRPAG